MSDPPAVLRTALLDASLQPDTEIERVEVARVELAPGQPAGLHLHPCPVVGCVTAGVIRFQVADGPVVTLHAGDAFFEPANVRIPHFDNLSTTEAAVFVACYLLGPGEDRLIEMLEVQK
jgi:quercetin dioxygenase-like cupin family protein